MSDNSIWDQTYLKTTLKHLPVVDVFSAIHGNGAHRQLIARINIDTASGGGEAIKTHVALNLTPAQMRDLANLLNQHAARIEDELIPLLHPEPAPEIIPFQLYHEPEAA